MIALLSYFGYSSKELILTLPLLSDYQFYLAVLKIIGSLYYD